MRWAGVCSHQGTLQPQPQPQPLLLLHSPTIQLASLQHTESPVPSCCYQMHHIDRHCLHTAPAHSSPTGRMAGAVQAPKAVQQAVSRSQNQPSPPELPAGMVSHAPTVSTQQGSSKKGNACHSEGRTCHPEGRMFLSKGRPWMNSWPRCSLFQACLGVLCTPATRTCRSSTASCLLKDWQMSGQRKGQSMHRCMFVRGPG
mmetsp:Transcript_18036/g.30844  ORF Transcript_18036/g.30844 Transcript_18036/m.30844 type:complete len:200 (+) Transcript_18036:18-617(+)